MLFDLRGRGRRRTIQAIYLTLAILMGGGLVFFGIGGNTSGGLFDALGLRGDSNSGGNAFSSLEKAALRRTRLHPRDPKAWASLTRARVQIAGSGENFDQSTGVFTDKGRGQLRRAERAWDRYLALDPAKPDANVATLMVQAFGPAGLNEPAKAVRALDIVTQVRPSGNAFYQLAVFAYAAGDTRKGDLAAAETLRRTDSAQRAQVKRRLADAKKQGVQPTGTGAG